MTKHTTKMSHALARKDEISTVRLPSYCIPLKREGILPIGTPEIFETAMLGELLGEERVGGELNVKPNEMGVAVLVDKSGGEFRFFTRRNLVTKSKSEILGT